MTKPRQIHNQSALLLFLLPLLGACATLEQAGLELPNVDFSLDRASGARLAGVSLEGVRRLEDLRSGDLLAVADALRRDRLPLRFVLHVGATNRTTSALDLRLDRLEWTLLLEDRETVRGDLSQDFVLAAGRSTDIPVSIELDLLRFFDDNRDSLVNLALRAAGAGGAPTNLKLRARPTFRTPFGLLRYPNELVIVSRDV